MIHLLKLYLLGFTIAFVGCANSKESGEDLARVPDLVSEDTIQTESDPSSIQDTLRVCSFNIQFLGHFKDRNNAFLADLLNEYDLVIIQEMVAAPVDGVYPDGSKFKADKESAAFLEEMLDRQFEYWVSEEDTGPTKNHTSSSASEWWIAFYRPDKLVPDSVNQKHGFLDTLLVGNASYERVPYAFPFKTVNGNLDFTMISVHLKPGGSASDQQRRNEELRAINNWINSSVNNSVNQDFYILGDCNIKNKTELAVLRDDPEFLGFQTLNDQCISTNTKFYEAPEKGKPYDHVFYNQTCTEDLLDGSFSVIDLYNYLDKAGLKDAFTPYAHDDFRTSFSDHMPVSFMLLTSSDGD